MLLLNAVRNLVAAARADTGAQTKPAQPMDMLSDPTLDLAAWFQDDESALAEDWLLAA
jgi:hypothetical protein